MLTLDDEEMIAERPVGVDAPPPGRSFNLRPLVIGLTVVLAGGGLGTAGYFLSNMDTRAVIGMLDVADSPRLALDMPGRAGEARIEEAQRDDSAQAQPGGLLTPPGAVMPAPAGPPPVAVSPPPPPPPTLATQPASPAPASPTPASPTPTLLAQPVPRNPAQPPSYASLPARVGDVKPLPPVPIEELVQQSAVGALPMIGRDGRQPWQAYARPFDDAQNRPRLAVVVVGLGLDKNATEAAIAKLPPEVTLAFTPYAGGLDKWVRKARDAGHEVLLALPAEGTGYPARDPGPWGLLSTNQPGDNIGRLEKMLARVSGYTGVWIPAGPFTRSDQLQPVLGVLRDRGLLFVGEGVKDEPGPPALAPSATIDVEPFRDAIDTRLAQVVAQAPQKGRVAVVASARPVTLDSLIVFLAKLPDHGVALAPASAVMRQGGKS